jgi:hypothetical protein
MYLPSKKMEATPQLRYRSHLIFLLSKLTMPENFTLAFFIPFSEVSFTYLHHQIQSRTIC